MDICWGIFNSIILQCANSINLARNEYYNMYRLAKEEGNKQRATETLLRVFYIDVNSNKTFAPAIIKEIGNHEEYYDPSYINRLYSSPLVINELRCRYI